MTRKYVVSLAGIALASFVACRPVDPELEDFRNGVPREQTVQMQVPAQAGQALTAEVETRTQALAIKGLTAETYVITRAVSGVVNGSGAWILGLMKAVVSHRPTSLQASTATWGPWTAPLDPVAWKVTVEHLGDHEYRYEVAGRDRRSGAGAFTVVLSGKHAASVDASGRAIEGFGSGEFTLDWDARATLPVPGREVGSAHYRYSRTSAAATVEVDADFRKVRDDKNPDQRVDVAYRYRSTPGAGGSMQFVHSVPAAMAANGSRWAVKSRWTEQGAGRADVRATGGDLPTTFEATASECWDTDFDSAFFQANWPLAPSYGSEATDCAFKPAEFSNL